MFKRLLLALAFIALAPMLALAQQTPTPAGYSVLGGQGLLSVTSSSSRLLLPASNVSYSALTIFNGGATDAYFLLGDVTVVATTSTPSILVKAGTAITVYAYKNTYIAGVTASSTSSLVIYQASGPVNFAGGGGSGGGGGGNVTVIGPVDGNGNVKTVIVDSTGTALTYNANGQASAANSSPVVAPSSTVAGAAVATTPVLAGVNVSGALIQATASAPISISTGTTTQLVALSSGKAIYVTNYSLFAGGTGNVTLEYGTGSNCGSGTTALTGIYNLTAQAGLVVGNGTGPVLVVPASNALCALTSASVQISGSVSYAQF